MIGAIIADQLGNQMMRYAFVRSLKEKRGKNEDIYLYFSKSFYKNKDGDSLKFFNTKYIRIEKNPLFKFGSIKQILMYLLYGVDTKIIKKFYKPSKDRRIKWFPRLWRCGVLYSMNNKDLFDTPKQKNVFAHGDYQNPQHFHQIRNILKEEFTPKIPIKKENIELYSIINNTNSVCVHFRRGDYFEIDKYRKTLYLCDENYIHQAINIIKKKIDNPTFIFFSNDIEYMKKNIDVGNYPVYYESGDDPVYETFRLMYSCKHFIISNSTFSWWAQYLSNNPNKIVVSPNRWYNAELISMLIDDSFIKINV